MIKNRLNPIQFRTTNLVTAHVLICFCFLSLLLNTMLAATEVIEDTPPKYSYISSMYSPNIKVSFFGTYNEDIDRDNQYEIFSIVTEQPFGEIEWKEYGDKFFYLSHGTIDDYNFIHNGKICSDLIDQIEGFSSIGKEIYRKYHKSDEKYDEVNLNTFLKILSLADTVLISFGAGISQGYVPTLEESCSKLGLTKIPSSDKVTDESMERFVLNLWQKPSMYLKKIEEIWGLINDCRIDSTPAHKALSELIQILKREEKNTFVYTDNIDGIHDKCAIPLSREKLEEQDSEDENSLFSYQSVIYPNNEDVDNKNVISILIGQSFDFDWVQSHIYNIAPNTQFFSINLSRELINIFKGLNMHNIPNEGVDPLSLEVMQLPKVRVLCGSVHDLLPEILHRYKSDFSTV